MSDNQPSREARIADYEAKKRDFEVKYRAWRDGGRIGSPPPRPIPPHTPGWKIPEITDD